MSLFGQKLPQWRHGSPFRIDQLTKFMGDTIYIDPGLESIYECIIIKQLYVDSFIMSNEQKPRMRACRVRIENDSVVDKMGFPTFSTDLTFETG